MIEGAVSLAITCLWQLCVLGWEPIKTWLYHPKKRGLLLQYFVYAGLFTLVMTALLKLSDIYLVSRPFNWFERLIRWGYFLPLSRKIAVGFYLWLLICGIYCVRRRAKFEGAISGVGLHDRQQKPAKFLYDIPCSGYTRKVVITNPSLSLEDFEKEKGKIEGACNFRITDIRYGKTRKLIEIEYTEDEIKEVISYNDFYHSAELTPHSFGVGFALSMKSIYCDLFEMVHMLVAGETSGGKSSFLRQMLTCLLLNNDDIEYLLIDLKGGIEFRQFEGIPHVRVASSLQETSKGLEEIAAEMDRRLALICESGTVDIDAYNQRTSLKLPRYIVVVDESAEMFYASADQPKRHLETARIALERIARLARAAGIHLVLATQRPDKTAIPPQIKDNLSTKLCFRVNSDVASTLVLGNGKASRLDRIQGRGIWKQGMEEMELQVPYLKPEESRRKLREHYGITSTSQPIAQKITMTETTHILEVSE